MADIVQTVETVKKVTKGVNTDGLEAKVVSMLDALQQGAVQLGHTAVKYAPDVQEAVLMIVRINAIQHIVAAITILSVIQWPARKLYTSVKNGADIEDAMWLAVPLFLMSVIPIFMLFDVWNWVAIFEPKLALAKQIVDSVIK